MSLPGSLQVALKEWDTVCSALETGRQIMLLRKGGIRESGGEFELDHRQFLLFPTYVHQNVQMLKPDAQPDYRPHASEPEQVRLAAAGEVTDIIQVAGREQVDALDAQHIWTTPLIDMRFNYRPENPLYILLVRAYRLDEPVTIQNTPAYSGCKSWVPLDKPIAAAGMPALNDADFAHRREAIVKAITSNAPRP